jgi:hypothetical protein
MTLLHKVSTLPDPVSSDEDLAVQRKGWAVLSVRPNFKEYGQVLWSDLLTSLGHDLSTSSTDRALTNSDLFAYAWLASDLTDDLVAGANLLPPRSLVELCSVTASLGIRTWLLYDIESCDEREEAEHGLSMIEVPLGEYLEIRRQAAPVESDGKCVPFPLVPDVGFLGFLATAESVMSPEDFALTAERYHLGRCEMRERIERLTDRDESAIASQLHEMTVHSNDINEITAIVRGAQAGAFRSGWHLMVDVQQWILRGMMTSLGLKLEDADWRSLSRLYKMHELCVCSLSTLGMSVEDMPDVTADAVADDGMSVTHKGTQLCVPEQAQRFLVAQHIYRLLVGAETDRFLVQGPHDDGVNDKAAGRILKLVTRDTGVALRGHASSRRRAEGTGWMRRAGVSISRFASCD